MVCPNTNDPAFVALVKSVGESKAYALWAKYKGEVPSKYLEVEGPPKINREKGLPIIPLNDSTRDLYKGYNLLTNDGQIKQVPMTNETRIWINTLNLSSRYSFYLRETTGGKKILIGPKRIPETRSLFFDLGEDNTPQEFTSKDPELSDKQAGILEKQLINLLKPFGITVETFNNFKEEYGVDATGVADLANRIIRVKDRNSLPEEASHFIIRMIKGTPLYNGLEDMARKSQLYKSVRETYSNNEFYPNENKILEETMGKLLAQAFKDNVQESNPTLFRRIMKAAEYIWNWVTGRVKENPAVESEISRIYKEFAGNVLADTDLLNPYQLDNSSDIFFSKKAEENIRRTRSIKATLEDAVDVLERKIRINEQREEVSGSYTKKKKQVLAKLKRRLAQEKYVLGMVDFINTVQSELIAKDGVVPEGQLAKYKAKEKELEERIRNGENYNEIAKSLRTMLQYYSAYKPTIETLNSILQHEDSVTEDISEVLSTKQFTDFKNAIKDLKIVIEHVENTYLELGHHLVEKEFQKITTEDGLDVSAALDILKEDESMLGSLLHSMAESKDPISRIIDKLVKQQKAIARLRTTDFMKDLVKLKEEYEKKGMKNFDFIFEKTDGKVSGYFIDQFNRGAWAKAKQKYIDENIKDKNLTHIQQKRLMYTFYKANGTEKKPAVKYVNPDFQKLTSDQKAIVNTLFELKVKLDEQLPTKFQNIYLVPQFRKDLFERIVSGPLVDIASQIKQSVGDSVIRREDDTEYGLGTIKDEAGRRVQFLPIYGNVKIKDPGTNLSTDIVSTMVAYAAIVNDYHQMSKVVHLLEIAKDVLANREVVDDTSNLASNLLSKIKNLAGIAEEKRINTKRGVESENYKRLVDYYDMIIYGELKADQGYFNFFGKKIDTAKAIDLFGKYVATNNLAFNLYAGINNVTLGNLLTVQESIAREYFTKRDLAKAYKTMGASVDALDDIGRRNAKSKLMLWEEYHDVLQDYESRVRNIEANRTTKMGQLFRQDMFYAFNKMGEFQIQMSSSLALANNIKLRNSKGQLVSYWDAFSAKDGKLILNDTYTIEDGGAVFKKQVGEKITPKNVEKYMITFSNVQNHVNQELHGIYNTLDKNAIQKGAIGRLVIMFRKFLVPAINRRYRKKRYNEMSQSYKEGYMRTTGRFFYNLIADVEKAKVALAGLKSTKNLTEEQKLDAYNLRRGLFEIATFIALLATTSLLLSDLDPDDDDWALSMFMYQVHRLYTEVGAFIPPAAAQELFRILESPAAGVNQAEDIVEALFNILSLNGEAYTHEIESGPYKGFTPFTKSILKITPFAKTFKGFLHPEEKIKFFTAK